MGFIRTIQINIILALFLVGSAMAQDTGVLSTGSESKMPFKVTGDRLGVWDGRDYNPLFLKGMNLGVSVPGTQPGELAASAEDYRRWFELIKEAGYNLIRIYTLHFPRFYEELKAYNESNPRNPLYVMHGVWLDEQEVAGDLFLLSDNFDLEIRDVIDAVHGNITIDHRFGKAYGNFTADISPWVIGYLIGREIFPSEVSLTNEANPDKVTFTGQYYFFPNAVDPIEVWLANRIETLASHEKENYNCVRPVGISSWPTLDPLVHPTEQLLPDSEEDSEQVDMADIEWTDQSAGFFIGYHAYPYYPDFIIQDPEYAVESDFLGPNSYLGYLKDLKDHYSNIPLFIAEFGVPTSWGSGHLSPTGMNHGGLTEQQQGDYTVRMLDNIFEANCAGGFQFSLIDEWFKQTWITNPFSDKQQRPYWHNITSPEQNFGVLSFKSPPDSYLKIGDYPGMEIEKITAHADFDFFRIRAFINTMDLQSDTLWVAIDTYLEELGESILPNGTSLGVSPDTLRAEFILMIPLAGEKAKLYVTPSYDVYGIKKPVRLDTVVSTPSDAGEWNLVRWKTNYLYDVTQYIGELSISASDDPFQFLNAVSIFNDSIEIRLPWTLINFYAPNKRRVIHYQTYLDGEEIEFISEDSLSDGIALTLLFNGDLYQTSRFVWNDWEYDRIADDPPLERKKQAFFTLKEMLPFYNNPPIGIADSFGMLKRSVLNVAADSGLLSNDIDLDGNKFFANLSFGNGTAHGQLSLHPDGSFQYNPENNFVGTDYFMYYLGDGFDFSSLVPVHISVEGILGDNLVSDGPEEFFVFPNPGAERFSIISRSSFQEVTMHILDLSGRLVMEEILDSGKTDIFLRNVNPGIYLFKFISGDQIEVHKVIVQ